MKRLTRAEIEAALLQGQVVQWVSGSRDEKLKLGTPVQRRLLRYLLGNNVRVIRGLPQAFIDGLAQAFEAADDPALAASASATSASSPGVWRLVRLECSGFGGINIAGGQPFVHDFDGKSFVIDGPNGSGKSSLIGALTWALAGERIRETGSLTQSHQTAEVFDDAGAAIGKWPPLACYPSRKTELAVAPVVWVKLTFANSSGKEAELERRLQNGTVSLTRAPELAIPTVLVETGVMMPARLSQIRLDGRDRQLADVVQMLTGLDEIAALGDFVGDLCHRGREYLAYSKSNRRDDIEAQFSKAMEQATQALASIGRICPAFKSSDTKDENGPMATLGRSLKQEAVSAVDVIKTELSPSLDLSNAATQQQVAAAIEGAKVDVEQGLDGFAAWTTSRAIASALDAVAAGQLQSAIDLAATQLSEAVALHEKAQQDTRYRLKALGAAWHRDHASGPVESCPLCSQDLNPIPGLAEEIESLKSAGAAASRAFRDNLNAIKDTLDNTLPVPLRRLREDVISLDPPGDLMTQIRQRFITAPRYSTHLTGLAQQMQDALATAPSTTLAIPAPIDVTRYPAGTEPLLKSLAISDRFLAVTEWWAANHGSWQAWWNQLTQGDTTNNPHPPLTSSLKRLDDAVVAWTPFGTAANALRQAWKQGRIVDQIDTEQQRRQKITDNLEPLKNLRKFAEAETRSAIEGLSGRMSVLLDQLYISERLKFQSTHLEKKSGVSVRGGFDAGIRVNASLVANASWMRALLWAFIFSVRDEAIEQLKNDAFPLLVLDDPQATFDISHRHRWIQRIVALQKKTPPMQVLLTTHDEPFLDQLSRLSIDGVRGHLSPAHADLGHIHIAEGSALERAWRYANEQKTAAAGHQYLQKARIHVEAMLKVMLRGELDTWLKTIGDLNKKIEALHNGQVQPWHRPIFRDLINQIRGAPEIKYLENSHHTTGHALGMPEATDAEKFWREKLSPMMDTAFRQIREYRLVHGESKALHADPPSVQYPKGHQQALRKVRLQIVSRAAALSGGRLADGSVSLTDLGTPEDVHLGHHEAYRIVTPSLEPVARSGDIVLVKAAGSVPIGSLAVVVCGDKLVARRFQVSADHPDIAVLVAQAITPSLIAAPLIAHTSTIQLRKIVGVLFDPSAFMSTATGSHEVVDCGGDTAITNLISNSISLVEVSGQSAEPQALDGQFLMVPGGTTYLGPLSSLDGRPVLATDTDGHQYFKRLRLMNKDTLVLESLHSAGEYPPILLSVPGNGGLELAAVRPVIGVLFERS